ncbi:MAG: AAA family ATPase [Rickettsiaceae bacterium]|nr:AAA family ATPase [Rickettsiaceae bacterium]
MSDGTAEYSIHKALSIAREHNHEYATLEHLLLALLEDEKVTSILKGLKIDVAALRTDVFNYIDTDLTSLIDETTKEAKPTAGFQRVIHRASVHSNANGEKNISSTDILLEFFFEHESKAVAYLKNYGVTRMDLISYMSKKHPKTTASTNADDSASDYDNSISSIDISSPIFTESLDVKNINITTGPQTKKAIATYCIDLNKKAEEGKIDILIGRDKETQRTIEILCRRQKNNAILVGEPGVGKTAIAEGLAVRIVSKKVPKILENAIIYALDLGALVAGTKYRGDFEERIKSLVEEFKDNQNAILFIDEIHTMIGAGVTSGGSMDASNLLKPALARGEIRCIGSTTFKEFRNHFEKDMALVRRFQKVVINEPTVEETLNILRGLKDYYEEHHGVKYQDEALIAAVHLSQRYITDRHLPDKAIDILDESGARKKVLRSKSNTVTERDIEEIVAMMTHLPSIIVSVDDTKKLKTLESQLNSVIFGQGKAISELCSSIKMAMAGLRESSKPTGCYLFAGSTGVGKTELAKQLSNCCSMNLVRLDMSEYAEAHAISRLIGTPPGYVGFDQGGLLTEAVDKSPYSVVLFDEIEKAHHDIYSLLLQIMDHGKITDSTGKSVNFCHTIIILTTNCSSSDHSISVGFNTDSNYKESAAMESINAMFTPEFRSRLDNIILFRAIDDNMMKKIINKDIEELSEQLADKGVRILVDSSVTEHLLCTSSDRKNGARTLSRAIDVEMKEKIAEEILFGKLKKGGTVFVRFENDKMIFEFEKTTPVIFEKA